MSSETAPQLEINVKFNELVRKVSNVYYMIRIYGEDGKNEIRKVDCRHQYTGVFSKVDIGIDEKWFIIECMGALKEGQKDGMIVHPFNHIIEFGVEYFATDNK